MINDECNTDKYRESLVNNGWSAYEAFCHDHQQYTILLTVWSLIGLHSFAVKNWSLIGCHNLAADNVDNWPSCDLLSNTKQTE